MIPASGANLGKRLASSAATQGASKNNVLNWRKWSGTPKSKAKKLNVVENLRVMTYNILADGLLPREMFNEDAQTQKYLDWNHRVEAIFTDEIDPLDPDIILFQEKEAEDEITVKKLLARNYLVGLQLFSSKRRSDTPQRPMVWLLPTKLPSSNN